MSKNISLEIELDYNIDNIVKNVMKIMENSSWTIIMNGEATYLP